MVLFNILGVMYRLVSIRLLGVMFIVFVIGLCRIVRFKNVKNEMLIFIINIKDI